MKCNINSLTILSIYNDLFKRKNYPYVTRRGRRVHAHSLGTVPAAIWGQSPLLLGDSPCCYSRTAWGQVPAATMGTVPAAIGGQSPLLFFCPVLPAPNPVLPVPPPAGEVRSGDCPHRSVGRDEGVASTGAGNRGVPAGSRQDSSPRPVPLRHHTPRARRSRAARFPSRPQCRWHGHRP